MKYMYINSYQKGISFTAAPLVILCIFSFSFAQEKDQVSTRNRGFINSGAASGQVHKEIPEKIEAAKPRIKRKVPPNVQSETNISAFQAQAQIYRDQALDFQSMGNLEAALTFYQKASQLDPGNPILYNDLGIIYEAQGFTDRAEENYLRAWRLDPNNLSVYSNLALLYENKRDLEKAVFYWKKRVELGSPDDPWTQKAGERLKDLAEVVPSLQENRMEQDAMRLAHDVVEKKRTQKKQVQDKCAAAKKLFKEGNYTKASDELYNVLSLDPQNKEAPILMDQIQRKVMEEKKNAYIKEIQAHFKEGLKNYEQDNLQKAKKEFDKVNELAASPLK